jgi:hypothetical protein
MNRYWLMSTVVCLLVWVVQPANQVVESLWHFGYTEFGGVAIAMPVNYETEEPQETTEPEDIEPEPDVHVPVFDLSDVHKGQRLAGGYIVTSLQGPNREFLLVGRGHVAAVVIKQGA